MVDLFKMEMRRLLRSKTFYIILAVMTVMALATAITSSLGTGVSDPTYMFGGVEDASGILVSGLNSGILYVLLGIVVTLFVCNDFSSGFAKNIFSVHASKWDYVLGKLFSAALFSALLLVAFTIELSVFALLTGKSIMPGGILDLVQFLLQKWVVSWAFSSIILFFSLLTRNKAVGIVASMIVGVGVISLVLTLLSNILRVPFIMKILPYTVSGASLSCTFQFDPASFVRTLVVCIVWTGIYGFLANTILKTKDI